MLVCRVDVHVWRFLNWVWLEWALFSPCWWVYSTSTQLGYVFLKQDVSSLTVQNWFLQWNSCSIVAIVSVELNIPKGKGLNLSNHYWSSVCLWKCWESHLYQWCEQPWPEQKWIVQFEIWVMSSNSEFICTVMLLMNILWFKIRIYSIYCCSTVQCFIFEK